MSLGLEIFDTEKAALSLTRFNNITDCDFVELVQKNKSLWLSLYEEYQVLNKIDRVSLLHTDPEEYKELMKKINSLRKTLSDLKKEIWNAGYKIENNETKPLKAKKQKNKGITSLVRKVMAMKKKYNLDTPITPYRMSMEDLQSWLEVAYKAINNEELTDEDKVLLTSKRKAKKKKKCNGVFKAPRKTRCIILKRWGRKK